ncbi:MAG: hypothetical protein NZ480_08950 [Bdellovibrionaceae bacterium]|nr:hypothetical protein [Pseudobdellovibrionaceae bacterium]MDW8189401.1 hypothetical protein [Pseudobdellovibrionaceae bacterium]
MMGYELVLKAIRNKKAFLFEFRTDGLVFIYDGIVWEKLDNPDLPALDEWLPTFVDQLTPDIKMKHKNQASWRVELDYSGENFICSYSHHYKSLRISRAPSKALNLKEWGFLENQIKSLSQPGQITLITGPQMSGKSTLQKLLMKSSEIGGVLPVVKEPGSLIPSPRIWYFGDEKNIPIREVLDLSLYGQSVCLAFEALDLEACLLRFFEHIPTVFQDRVIQFLTVVETRLLPGVEQLVVPFSSFYQLRYCPQIMLDKKDWNALLTWNEGSKENFNVRTLNQALLQGVIRRKIEMQTAFSASTFPEGLDLLLKRLGV